MQEWFMICILNNSGYTIKGEIGSRVLKKLR